LVDREQPGPEATQECHQHLGAERLDPAHHPVGAEQQDEEQELEK
jgi:hypothetical protein